MQAIENKTLADIAIEIRTRLQKVIEQLSCYIQKPITIKRTSHHNTFFRICNGKSKTQNNKTGNSVTENRATAELKKIF